MKEKVSAREYVEWVYDTVITDGYIEAKYDECGNNEDENMHLLHAFFDHLADLACEQCLCTKKEDDSQSPLSFEDIVFKIKDRYFIARKSFDEPGLVSVELLDEPKGKFIVIKNE